MENLGFLVAAYSIIWITIAIFIFILSRRQRQLRQDIDSVKAKIGQKDVVV